MPRDIRNKFAPLLRAYGAENPHEGLVLGDTLIPVTVVDHAREMVPPISGRMFGFGPPISAVVGARPIAMVQMLRDACITGITSDIDDSRCVAYTQSFGATLAGLITTQSGSNISGLGPDGQYTPLATATYGTTTLAGDDGFLLPTKAPMPLSMNPYLRAGEWFTIIGNQMNVAANFGLAWVEFPLDDIGQQEHVNT